MANSTTTTQMPLSSDHFLRTLEGLHGLLPYGKKPSEATALLAWQTFPAQAKAELTNSLWTYAAGQYMLDPDTPRDVPIHLAMLRYLYRLRDGSHALDWGLKTDLPQRLKHPDQFHQLNTYMNPDMPLLAPQVT